MLSALATLLLAAAPVSSPSPTDVLLGDAIAEGGAMARLTDLTDRIGPRLSGSSGAAEAVRWAVEQFKAAGVPVRTEPVTVKAWVRGEERGEVLAGPGHRAWPLALTALGGSAPTPPGGVEGEVVEVDSLEALATAQVAGRIVYFHHEMSAASEYEKASELRTRGPARAAARGAIATLVRTLATASLRSPHTGAVVFKDPSSRIPAVAIATEDAAVLHRWLHAGPVRVRLVLGCRNDPDVESANVVAEIKGRERPSEIVLLGAHLDSWDLAVGAQDDGAGVVIVLDSARLIARLKPAPRRTIRFVLFMNEENGGAGSKAYAAAHGKENHVVGLEADAGSGRAQSVEVHAGDGGTQLLAPLVQPLGVLGIAARVQTGPRHGADLGALARTRGLATVGVRQDSSHYFDIHHSAADTLDKVDPAALGQVVAAHAWLTWALADAPGALVAPSIEPTPAGD
jgi:carboxypeptidase Q